MTNKYILQGHIPVPEEDVLRWGKWFETADRGINDTLLPDGKRVSTIFLGLNHEFCPGKEPLLFETMVFELDSYRDIDCQRYTTWEEAEKGHQVMVTKWTNMTKPMKGGSK